VAPVATAIRQWFLRHDPGLAALHRAIKLAVTSTLALAIARLVSDNAQLAIFASFGCVALLLFADFPGDQRARLSAYLFLGAFGVILVVLGTLASEVGWIAVASMAIVGFGVTFAGVLSAAVAAATRAALLTFILPVTIPGSIADAPARVAGWALAVVLAIPVAVLIWPPRDHDAIRVRSADACRAIAAQLRLLTHPDSSDDGAVQSATVDATTAMVALRQAFRSTTFRPVGLTTGSRLLSRLVDQLEWLRAVAARGVAIGAHHRWSDDAARIVSACADVLEAAATTVESTAQARRTQSRSQLDAAMSDLVGVRRGAVDAMHLAAATVVDVPPDPAGTVRDSDGDDRGPPNEPPGAVVHELVYTTGIVGQTIAASAAADSRPVLDRLIGRWNVDVGTGPWAAAHEIAYRRASLHSVWMQNSVRAAVGLALAVWLAQVTEVGHSFWIVLGTLSVLRTTAIATGATALRAFAGTLAGFVVGGGLVIGLGTSPSVLWVLLPLALLVAGFAPSAISFAAGQAAFTVLVVILFNLIDPVGWSVGLVRIEDVAIGCAAGLVSGLFLWPAGAVAEMRIALAESHRTAADALSSVTRAVVVPSEDARAAGLLHLRRAGAAAGRVDDAFRSYLADRGSKPIALHELYVAANGARRVWVAAEAIAATPPLAGPVSFAADYRLGVMEAAEVTSSWFRSSADALDGEAKVPMVQEAAAERLVLTAVAADPASLDDGLGADTALTLWEIALHVDSLTRLEGRLTAAFDVLVHDSDASTSAEAAQGRAERLGEATPSHDTHQQRGRS
jgi:hypothetical protein